MVGLSCDRFPDLSADLLKPLAEEMTCGICRQIYDNPVETYCKHTYCLQCLQELVTKHGQKSCPECRKPLTTRKRTQSAVNDNNIVIIDSNVIVDKNRKVNAMVGKLRINCEFRAEGCRTVCPLESLPTHLKTCRYKICETCSQSMGLKNELIEWKDNYKLLENESKLLAEKTKQLETKLNESEEKSSNLELKHTSDRNEWQTKSKESTKKLKNCRQNLMESMAKVFKLESKYTSDRNEWQTKCNELIEKIKGLETKVKESEEKKLKLMVKCDQKELMSNELVLIKLEKQD